MNKKGNTASTVPGWYIGLQSAVLLQLPRPGEIDQSTAEEWTNNQASLKKNLAECLVSPLPLAQRPEKVKVSAVKNPKTVDSIIRVDRSIKPVYPDEVTKVMHPELESSGPAEYDISQAKRWFHYYQKIGRDIRGEKIYAHLEESDMLKTCLGTRDLEEIQKKGVVFFREYFKEKVVFGWKGVVRYHNGYLHIPYLCGDSGEVVMDWDWLDTNHYRNYSTLLLASDSSK